MMKKEKAIYLTIVLFILGFLLNFLLVITPDEDFKNTISDFSNSMGLSYLQFWIICTFVIIVVSLAFVWMKVKINSNRNKQPETTNVHKRETNIIGDKPTYVEKNNGDINIY